ncbi:uncharacterized protein LOC107789115 [Nicotiana tabacum]|uniref:Uncharacterized protein LOC107789115 n=2 Tax=Nicotiana tabacum TaxID=4097 RepID=A0AC58SJ55_TOBAC|nr:PREDICTED: uncharacterized protein LOC107789115 [Nicotiana tabacum]
MEEAWLIMEDFNTILTNEDRVHGSEVQDDETANFRGFMDDCNLTEMPIIDHSPLGIEFEVLADTTKKPFKFYNCIAEDPEFTRIVQENWCLYNGKMTIIWQNLEEVRKKLKQLNKKKFAGVTKKIHSLRQSLKHIQGQMMSTNQNAELFEEEKNGRKAQNQIWMLKSVNEETIKRPEDIHAEISGFYQKLLRSAADTLPAIHPGIIKKGPMLSRSHQLQLIKPFTKEDVVLALKGIDDLKAPGGDGFNAYIFKNKKAFYKGRCGTSSEGNR